MLVNNINESLLSEHFEESIEDSQPKSLTSLTALNDEEIKRVADFFAILIKVDQRINNENKDK